jgi:hypothetical protein
MTIGQTERLMATSAPEVSELRAVSLSAPWLGSLGRLGWLVIPAFCLDVQ